MMNVSIFRTACPVFFVFIFKKCNETTKVVLGLTITSDYPGSIPDVIADLKHLEVLRLHKNSFLVGEIPPAIGKLSKLRSLDITWSNISGHIPAFLANLKNIQFLDLSFNNLSGSIPPSLGTLPKVIALDLSRNQLTGSIPESFGHFPEKEIPIALLLSHNKLSGGEVPMSLANIDFRVDISRNNFSADASMFFGTWKRTDMIVISRNNFAFNFSQMSFTEWLVRVIMGRAWVNQAHLGRVWWALTGEQAGPSLVHGQKR
ncbi:polygalacturonase inhibitor 1-like [Actinidia eriantha]|uniref:polygalacturonase inhibitor 1-like n=1 Tax=Actinidia eriantha TaxID=165200 RepID=UPI0025880BBF|nr:polygalacturonase inhibitor 1-like [Actinidia eriantha]